MARALAAAGCDLLLVETVAAADEGLAAVKAAAETGLPVWVAAMAMPGGAMKSGDDLRLFFQAARESGAAAALINFAPCQSVDLALAAARHSGLPLCPSRPQGLVDPDSGL